MYMRCDRPLPRGYLKGEAGGLSTEDEAKNRPQLPAIDRLRMQHARNFAAGVVGARSGKFAGVRHLVDVAGGTGPFAIPLIKDNPDIRITLVDRPEAMEGIREFVTAHGVADRIELVGFSVFDDEWKTKLPACDGVLFGNFFHMWNDEKCRFLARQAFDVLAPNGRVFLHEVCWNDTKDGPLVTALWHANMKHWGQGGSSGDGAQRTIAELEAILASAGFVEHEHGATAGNFTLLSAKKRG
jgi:SAM-dependent methyltransferase